MDEEDDFLDEIEQEELDDEYKRDDDEDETDCLYEW